MVRKKKPVETARFLYFVLLLTSFSVTSALRLDTNASTSLETKTVQPLSGATHGRDSKPIGQLKSGHDNSHEDYNVWDPFLLKVKLDDHGQLTCGTTVCKEIMEFCLVSHYVGRPYSDAWVECVAANDLFGYESCMNLRPRDCSILIQGSHKKLCCAPKEVNRTCNRDHHCTSRYCVSVDSKNGLVFCPEKDSRELLDKECNSLLKGDTKMLPEGKWCCKDSKSCETAQRKCGSSNMCQARFCQANRNKETFCPEAALRNEIACKELPQGKTINLGNEIWCCNADNCNTDVKDSSTQSIVRFVSSEKTKAVSPSGSHEETEATEATGTEAEQEGQEETEGKKGGSLHIVLPVLFALLILVGVGISVACYFIRRRKAATDKKTNAGKRAKPRRSSFESAQTKTHINWTISNGKNDLNFEEQQSRARTETVTAEKEATKPNAKGETKSRRSSFEETETYINWTSSTANTETYVNLNEIKGQDRDTYNPTLTSSGTGIGPTDTDSFERTRKNL